MVVDKAFIVVLLLFGFCLFFMGFILKKSKKDAPKEGTYQYKFLSKDGMVERLNNSSAARSLTDMLGNSKELESLFRRSKNPWNLTPTSYNAIRYLISGIALFLGIASLAIDWTISLIFAALAFMCFVFPKQKYEDAAKEREGQWNQLYQFVWVIKHNLNYYDPKKTWLETERYIKDHTDNLTELEDGFSDFAKHWNGRDIDDYLKATYCDFTIPKQLLDIVLTSQLTGEYPDNELTSLREIILEKMNFHVQEVLSTVGMKATLYSSPFLLMSVGLVVLVPVILQLIEAFS